jgi:hypothetical protein
MTRRLRWLAIGAVIGIAGYRRVARGTQVSRMLGVPAFLRDVRAGMAEYEQQHRVRAGELPARGARPARASTGGVRQGIAGPGNGNGNPRGRR